MKKVSTYDSEFKRNVVNLCKDSGRSVISISKEMGIGESTLHKWIKGYSQGSSFPGKGHVEASQAELVALRKELNHVRLERDILKKAVAIFSGPQGKGTHS